jgi:nuclear GTP-binding protein
MKVGKPQSKRVPVRLRHKIQKASAAKQRKQRKEAKKNPQWRSRLKKDPGIPNLFPFKAQVLAEIEENKRKKAEEAQKRREVAKAQREGLPVSGPQQNAVAEAAEYDDEELLDSRESEDEEDAMDEGEDSNPMAALLASAQARAKVYSHADDDEEDDEEDDDEEEEWGGIEHKNSKSAPAQPARKALPKQALADPIKAVSALLERLQKTADGIQRLIDYYQMPPLMTAGTDMTSSFLVEVARKRGRLGKGGVPNLHSAALIVLGDLNEERLVLPTLVSTDDTSGWHKSTKGDVQIVSYMAEPFRIEGLWEGEGDYGGVAVEKMAV